MHTLLLLGLLLANSMTAMGPDFPPNAVAGGTVVAELRFSSGQVTDISILDGGGAFADASRRALTQWRRDAVQDGHELVVVHFRSPNLYSVGDDDVEIRPADVRASLPYPQHIWPPDYPANVIAQGSVILRVKISANGDVSDVDTVNELGGLTDTGIAAVRKWKFRPATDRYGNAAASHAYVVLVYRFPATSKPAK